VRSRVLLVAIVLVSTVAIGGLAALDSQSSEVTNVDEPPAETLVSPDGANSTIWPYTSRGPAAAERTLALNAVVYGSPERVRRALLERTDANWSRTVSNETIDISPWRPTHGSVRYTYVTPDPAETGEWVPAAYQLHVGTYFGSRTHIRAYPSPSGNWTALQAHTEYWDWFRVRHTVTGVRPGAYFVERDLQDEPFVEDVERKHHGNRGGGSPGWWMLIDLATLFVAASTTGLTRRVERRELLLGAGLVGVVLGVRAWGLAAEALFPAVNPKLFVALGYPVLALGPPLLAVRLSRGRRATRAAAFAMAGLATGLALDFALIEVQQLPTGLVAHRVALVAALGLVALGAAREHRGVTAVGLAAWVVLLAGVLLGFL
jgi:hypothetical protein